MAKAAARRYPGGVWLVELASLFRSRLVPQAVAAALGLRESPGAPLIETLAAHLKISALSCCVLDNCEHLVEACAALAHALLTACPDLRILATSREPLRVTGETIWLVPPLALPDLNALPPVDELAQVEAVRLFVERARRALPDFALDEAHALPSPRSAAGWRAARWPSSWPPPASGCSRPPRSRPGSKIAPAAGRGRPHRPARHRTLQATLDWSYDLLSEPSNRCSAALPCSPAALRWTRSRRCLPHRGPAASRAWICWPDWSISRCSRSSLPAGSGRRYRYLEPVRQYALAKLEQSGEGAAARDRLLAWAVTLTGGISSTVFTARCRATWNAWNRNIPTCAPRWRGAWPSPDREVQGVPPGRFARPFLADAGLRRRGARLAAAAAGSPRRSLPTPHQWKPYSRPASWRFTPAISRARRYLEQGLGV